MAAAARADSAAGAKAAVREKVAEVKVAAAPELGPEGMVVKRAVVVATVIVVVLLVVAEKVAGLAEKVASLGSEASWPVGGWCRQTCS